jgi:hypothetical protein
MSNVSEDFGQEFQGTFSERAYLTSAKGVIDSGYVHHCDVRRAKIAPMGSGSTVALVLNTVRMHVHQSNGDRGAHLPLCPTPTYHAPFSEMRRCARIGDRV